MMRQSRTNGGRVFRINGKKVVDAKKLKALTITQKDCDQGDKKNPALCAAARAIRREFPGAIGAEVHLGRAYVEYPDKVVRYVTPKALRTEIVAFDRGGTFEPGEYLLNKARSVEKARYAKMRHDRAKGLIRLQPTTTAGRAARARHRPHIVAGVRTRRARFTTA